jgi:hypothetical protein
MILTAPLDVVEAVLGVRAAIQETAEHGVSVEARHAIPNHSSPAIQQSRQLAVADQREIEAAHDAAFLALVSSHSST